MADEAERAAGNSPAVTRSIRILDLLAEARGVPRTLTEIARELGLAKSSVSNLCAALEEGELVRGAPAATCWPAHRRTGQCIPVRLQPDS